MSKMSMLESGIGEKELKISEFRRIDYVVLQAIKGFVAGTLCFAAMFGLWFFAKWDDLNLYFADADFIGFARRVAIYYAVFMAIYIFACVIVAIKKYRRCKGRKEQYLKCLNHVGKSYRSENTEA